MLEGEQLPTLPRGHNHAGVSEQIKTAYTIFQDMATEPDLDPKYEDMVTMKHAAELLGMSYISVTQWVNGQKIPHEVDGVKQKKLIRKSVVEAVKELRLLHGPQWMKFAPWIEQAIPPTAPVVTPKVQDNFVLLKLRERAEECRLEKKFEASSEMFSLYFTLCDD